MTRSTVSSFALSSLLLLALIGGFIFGHFALRSAFEKLDSRGTVWITANIERGDAIELFANEYFGVSYRAPIQPGVTARYELSGVPLPLTYMRIDPTDQPGVSVRFDKVEIVDGTTVVETLPAETLQSWRKADLEAVPGSSTLKSTGVDPFIVTGGLHLAAAGHEGVARYLTLPLVVFAIVVVLALTTRAALARLVPIAILLALISTAGGPLVIWATENFYIPTDITRAVGNAVYAGYSKPSEQLAFFFCVLGAIAIGALLGWAAKNFPRAEVPAGASEETAAPHSRVIPILILFLFALLQFPRIGDAWSYVESMRHSFAGFDWANVFTWDYLAQNSLLPYRDYWFPYAGEYLQLGYFPSCVLGTYMVQLVLCAALAYSLYELLARRPGLLLLVLALLAAFIEQAVFTGTKRYLTSTAAILIGAALAARQPVARTPYLAFGAFLGWIAWREPSQLLYAAPGVAYLALCQCIAAVRAKAVLPVGKQMALVVVAAFAVMGGLFLRLHLNGQFAEFVKMHLQLGSAAVSSAIPTSFQTWFAFNGHYENILCLGLHLILAYGAYRIVAARSASEARLGHVMLALGFLTAMYFLKMLVRPTMAQQTFAPIFFAAVLLAAEVYVFSANYRKVFVTFAAGTLIASSFMGGWWLGKIQELPQHAARVATDVSAMLSKGVNVSPAERDAFFAASRFENVDEPTRALVAYFEAKRLAPLSRELFVLGGDSYLYPMLHLRPCPYINLYDASSVWAQEDMLNCLREHPPRYIVWNNSMSLLDGVPLLVRVPLLFNYVAEHFVFERRFGPYELLRPREKGDAFDWSYWTTKLGTRIDLGAIPNFGNSCRPHVRAQSVSDASDFAEILDRDLPSSALSLDIEVQGRKFQVTYKPMQIARASIDEIALDRLWFWHMAKKEGVPHRILPRDSMSIRSCTVDNASQLY